MSLTLLPLRNVALTVHELEENEFHWVLLEATDTLLENDLPYAPLDGAEVPCSTYAHALVAGLAVLRRLGGTGGPRAD